jgi:hypothetical protein
LYNKHGLKLKPQTRGKRKMLCFFPSEERPVRVDNSRVNSRWKKIIVDNSRAMRAPFTSPLATYDSLK